MIQKEQILKYIKGLLAKKAALIIKNTPQIHRYLKYNYCTNNTTIPSGFYTIPFTITTTGNVANAASFTLTTSGTSASAYTEPMPGGQIWISNNVSVLESSGMTDK